MLLDLNGLPEWSVDELEGSTAIEACLVNEIVRLT